MVYLIALADAQPEQADLIGNKAAGLVELVRAGFDVPTGVCLTTPAYRAWRTAGAIGEDVRAAALEAFGALRPPLAVRSSSPAEDRADASFAGQYKTVLGVRTSDQLFAAIEECWRSAVSVEAMAYRRAQGAELEVEMALVIQELVPATAAGVLFSCHPVTDRVDQVVVNANFGLGESVVSGRSEPDTFILDKATGAATEARPGSKPTQSVLTQNGVEEVASDPAHRETLSLDSEQLSQLVVAARRLEAYFDSPVDAEWAFVDQTLHMLQARPVTTGVDAYYTDLLDQWARDREMTFDPDAIWARGSPLSGLPVSPLYYSEMAAFFSDMFPAIAALEGLPPRRRRKSFRYYKGFTYSDVTFSSNADPAGGIEPKGFFTFTWRSNLRLGLRYPSTLAFWCNIDAYYRRWAQVWFPGLEARRPEYDTAEPTAIRDYIEYIEVQRRERSIFAALGVKYASDYLSLLADLIGRWAPGMPDDTIGLLTSGLPESLTHDENVELWRLAQTINQTPALRDLLLAARFDQIKTAPGGAELLGRVETFRRDRPHRGCSDRDLLQPRWGDDRALLLKQLAAMLGLGALVSPEAAHARTEIRRNKCEAAVLGKVARGPLGLARLAVFKHVLKAAQRYWIHRDNQRHTFDRYFYELRCAYRGLGARLAEQGALPDAQAVFFVGKTELYGYLDGELSAERLFKRSAWRRDWWNRVKTLEPPPMIQGNAEFRSGDGQGLKNGDLSGVGGAPGVAVGPVRHIRTLDELSTVVGGDILVVHAIDPAWTPVFGLIGGVISEEGGILSHATVLGREYGLPVIIGVSGAAGVLEPGETVEINGTTGAVRRLSLEAPESAATGEA